MYHLHLPLIFFHEGFFVLLYGVPPTCLQKAQRHIPRAKGNMSSLINNHIFFPISLPNH
jgi:hypothetical protein